MKKINTVVSLGLSRASNDDVHISISDEHSGDRILNISLSVKELGLLVTGLHGVKGVADVFEANIAKQRITKTVLVDCTHGEIVEDLVQNDYTKYYERDGWVIHSDGVRTQQPLVGKHNYIIKKYVEVEDVLNVERYY